MYLQYLLTEMMETSEKKAHTREKEMPSMSCQMPDVVHPTSCPPRHVTKPKLSPPPPQETNPPRPQVVSSCQNGLFPPVPHSSPVDPGWFGGQMKCKLPPYAMIRRLHTKSARNRKRAVW